MLNPKNINFKLLEIMIENKFVTLLTKNVQVFVQMDEVAKAKLCLEFDIHFVTDLITAKSQVQINTMLELDQDDLIMKRH